MKSLKEVVAFHGHICPGLALGWRVAKLALKEMGKRARDEELVAIVENDSCAVDAIQVMTGCTFGKGNLIFNDYGKQVYTFIKRRSTGSTADAIRIAVDWRPPADTPEEEAAWQRYMKGDRSPSVQRIVHRRRTKKINSILRADDKELFKVMQLKMKPPTEARIYRSITCEACGERVAEPKARLMNGKTLCLPCWRKAGGL